MELARLPAWLLVSPAPQLPPREAPRLPLSDAPSVPPPTKLGTRLRLRLPVRLGGALVALRLWLDWAGEDMRAL